MQQVPLASARKVGLQGVRAGVLLADCVAVVRPQQRQLLVQVGGQGGRRDQEAQAAQLKTQSRQLIRFNLELSRFQMNNLVL